MDRFRGFALSLLAMGAVAVLGAPVAGADTGTATANCTSVTFNYKDFAPGPHQVQETVYLDGYNQVEQVEFSFSGPVATHTVPLSVPSGAHTVIADAWNLWGTDAAQALGVYTGQVTGFDTEVAVNCGPPPSCPTKTLRRGGKGPYGVTASRSFSSVSDTTTFAIDLKFRKGQGDPAKQIVVKPCLPAKMKSAIGPSKSKPASGGAVKFKPGASGAYSVTFFGDVPGGTFTVRDGAGSHPYEI